MRQPFLLQRSDLQKRGIVSLCTRKGNELFGDFTKASGELNTAATTIRELVGSYDSARKSAANGSRLTRGG